MMLYIADKHDARVKTPENRAMCAQWVLFANTDLVRACALPVQVSACIVTASSHDKQCTFCRICMKL